MLLPTNNQPYRFPISVKGIIIHKQRILLLKNERNEWELPGGKLELGEEIEQCLTREIMEETTLDVTVQELIHTWVYTIFPNVHVFIVTYACSTPVTDVFHISNEHKEGKWFDLAAVPALNMPSGYKKSIHLYTEMFAHNQQHHPISKIQIERLSIE